MIFAHFCSREVIPPIFGNFLASPEAILGKLNPFSLLLFHAGQSSERSWSPLPIFPEPLLFHHLLPEPPSEAMVRKASALEIAWRNFVKKLKQVAHCYSVSVQGVSREMTPEQARAFWRKLCGP